MKLHEVFAAMGPLLEGRVSLDETGRALWPRGAVRSDVERLVIYERFCRNHRFATLDRVYADCRAVVEEAAGRAAWERLVAAYFRVHPAHHVELNHNGAALPEFLVGYAPQAGLPTWLPELADFAWWEWLTRSAPDDDADEDAGRVLSAIAAPTTSGLRLASTVELRPYRWDFVAWAEQPWPRQPPEEQPPARPTLVLFWRDRELTARREPASPIELAALKLVAEGLSLDQAVAAGIDRAALTEALVDLHAAGVVRGQP